MGPPDENLILGSDPAVLSSSSYPAFSNSILHVSHQTTAQRSNAMVVSCTLYSVNLKIALSSIICLIWKFRLLYSNASSRPTCQWLRRNKRYSILFYYILAWRAGTITLFLLGS